MDKKEMIGNLANGLILCVCDDIHGIHGQSFIEATGAAPLLQRIKPDALKDAVAELRNTLESCATEAAREFVEQTKGILVDPNDRICQCRNPKCGTNTVSESALLYHFPAPELITTISPGDTVPLGLCPDCRMPVYQPEEFGEDEVDADCDCMDCRQERLRLKLIGDGMDHVRAQFHSARSREQWERSEAKASCTEKYDPLYTD